MIMNVMRAGICTLHTMDYCLPETLRTRLLRRLSLARRTKEDSNLCPRLPLPIIASTYSATASQKTGVLHRWTTSRFPVCAGREGQPLDCCRFRFSLRLILLPFYFGAALLIHGLKLDTSFSRVQGELQRAVHLTPFTAAPESCRPSCPNVLILTLSRLPIRRPLRSTRFINTDLRCTALGLRERF